MGENIKFILPVRIKESKIGGGRNRHEEDGGERDMRGRAISAQYNVVHWHVPVRVVLLLSPEGSLGKPNTSLISSQVRPPAISWHTVEPSLIVPTWSISEGVNLWVRRVHIICNGLSLIFRPAGTSSVHLPTRSPRLDPWKNIRAPYIPTEWEW